MPFNRGDNPKALPPPGSSYDVPAVLGRRYSIEFYFRFATLDLDIPSGETKSLFNVGLMGAGDWHPDGTSPVIQLSQFIAAEINDDGKLYLYSGGLSAEYFQIIENTWYHLKLEYGWDIVGSPTQLYRRMSVDGTIIVSGAYIGRSFQSDKNVAMFGDFGRAKTTTGIGIFEGILEGYNHLDIDDLTISDQVDGVLYTADFEGGGGSGTSYYHDDWPDNYLFTDGYSGEKSLLIGVIPSAVITFV